MTKCTLVRYKFGYDSREVVMGLIPNVGEEFFIDNEACVVMGIQNILKTVNGVLAQTVEITYRSVQDSKNESCQ